MSSISRSNEDPKDLAFNILKIANQGISDECYRMETASPCENFFVFNSAIEAPNQRDELAQRVHSLVQGDLS